MNSIVRPCVLVLLSIIGLPAAELPKKALLARYTPLWENSPFTTKPKVDPGAPLENPFDNLVLKGVAPIAGGYLITLINKKNPAEAVPPIDTDRPSEYEVVKIDRDPDKPLGTVVTLKKGSQVGTVTYDDKLSAPKPPPAKPGRNLPGKPQVPGQPPQVPQAPQPPQPGQANPAAGAARQPRPRAVAPPTSGTQPGAPGTNATGRGGRGSTGGYQRPSGR